MKDKLKVGLIGAGRIGKMHAETIISNLAFVEIKSVADIYADDSMRKWASGVGIKNVFKESSQILEDNEIDAVIICSSTDTHSQLIIESAKAGKHVFCEKPIDFDVNKIVNALKAVDEAKVKLQIGFQRRFDPSFKKAHVLIREGKIGEPHILKITSRDPAPPPIEYIKVSGGIFLDMTIHDFDMARFLMGSEVTEVYAIGEARVDTAISEAGDIDTAIVTLKFENGALGVIDNSRKATYGYDQRVEVFGSKGCISVNNESLTNTMISNETGILGDKTKHFFIDRYRVAYVEEMKAFCDSIFNDKDPLVTGQDGLEPVIIGLAAKKSLEEGKPINILR